MSDKAIEKKRDVEYTRTSPPVDIYESESEFLILADMPGVRAGDVSIDHDPPTLTVEGRQPEDLEAPLAFRRSFTVPDSVDPGGIDARLRDGVLSITLRKAESAKPKKIEVRAG